MHGVEEGRRWASAASATATSQQATAHLAWLAQGAASALLPVLLLLGHSLRLCICCVPAAI